jgi:hypothetical protein
MGCGSSAPVVLEQFITPDRELLAPPGAKEIRVHLESLQSAGTTPEAIEAILELTTLACTDLLTHTYVRAYLISTSEMLQDTDPEMWMPVVRPFERLMALIDGKLQNGKLKAARLMREEGGHFSYKSHNDHARDKSWGLLRRVKIPQTAIYRIKVCGAQAADCGMHAKGGRGAIIEASFQLEEDDTLEILCGGGEKL